MGEQALTTTRPNGRTLEAYGALGDVQALAERIRKFLPANQRLTEPEALSLAQVAHAYGLDPFNGELWYLKTDDGRSLGLMAGIKGHRRAAHLKLEQVGGNCWGEFVQIPPAEFKGLGIPEGAVAFRYRLYDTVTIRAYVDQIERLVKASLPWDVVRSLVGERPYTEGVGYWRPGEKTKMSPVQAARKRAEADALKQRFDLPFGEAVGQGADADAVEGEFTVSESTPESLKQANTALYGEPVERAAQAATDPLRPGSERSSTAGLVSPAEAAAETPAAQAPEAPAEPEPADTGPTNGGAGESKPRHTATLRCNAGAFNKLASEFAGRHAHWQTPAGTPDRYHILASAYAEGFKTITDDVLEPAFEALAKRAAGKEAENPT